MLQQRSSSGIWLWLGFAACLLWPAVINGGPFWFPDTSNYIRAADAAVVVLTESPSEWSDRLTLARDAGEKMFSVEAGRPMTGVPDVQPTRPVLTNRSIYYGMFLYLPLRLAGPWGALILQALAVAAACLFCMSVVMRQYGSQNRVWITAIAGGLAFLTPLSFYTSMFMPDVWSGVLVALLGIAICFRSRMSTAESVAVLIACGIIATFHATHVLLAVAMAIAGLLVAPNIGQRVRGATIGMATALTGLAASLIFSVVVERYLGQEPISPPFLSARLTDSGPGVDYLAAHCEPETGPEAFALCRYRDRLPIESDSFLWSTEPRDGLFQLVPPRVQRQIAAEDKRFYMAVVLADPVGYAGSFIRNMGATLASYDMINFNYSALRVAGLRKLPDDIERMAAMSLAARREMPTRLTTITTVASVLISVLLLVPTAMRVMTGRIENRPTAQFAALLFLGVLANAAICGALSKPDARYHMRIVWLLPFAAGLLLRDNHLHRNIKVLSRSGGAEPSPR